MLISRIRNGLSILPLVYKLRRMRQPYRASELARFALAEVAIRPLQIESEISRLANLVEELRPQTVLEIGTARGGTLFIFSRLAAPGATLISIDLPGGRFGGGYGLIREMVFRFFPSKTQKLVLLKADSHHATTKKRIVDILGSQPLDLLFIDGDHTYEGVKQDFETYSPLVRPGGLIAFHDIVPHPDPEYGVSRFWNEIKTRNIEEFIENPHSLGYGIGVIKV